jgi:predicted  nucleic acid-binding Zn-ribbon protein
MAYKLGYSRLYNLGNYEHEEFHLEREFPDEVPASTAMAQLQEEVNGLHNHSEDFKKRTAEAEKRHTDIVILENELANVRHNSELYQEQIKKISEELAQLRLAEGGPC